MSSIKFNLLHLLYILFQVNGYKYVKFHLKGELVRDTVEDLRARVASWLLVPTSFVVVSGVQPTGSWHITLMIPEICLENLLKFIDVKRHWLTDQNIDSVELDGKVIDIAGKYTFALFDRKKTNTDAQDHCYYCARIKFACNFSSVEFYLCGNKLNISFSQRASLLTGS